MTQRTIQRAGDERRWPAAPDVHPRLGLDVPAGWWPSAAALKAQEAAGFRWVQVRVPSLAVVGDRALARRHAQAMRRALELTGLRPILHAPDALLAGSHEHDRALATTLDYAEEIAAELLVYHGAQVPIGAGAHATLASEEASLWRFVGRLERAGVTLAIENLAPVYPGPERACHDPGAVARLARRLDSGAVGTCFDLGHAHIAAELAGCALRELLEPVLDAVAVFHVHDNFGAADPQPIVAHVDPVKLDLHLPPGAGTLPWRDVAPLLARHHAPLQLEVHPMHRPSPDSLAVLAAALTGEPLPR